MSSWAPTTVTAWDGLMWLVIALGVAIIALSVVPSWQWALCQRLGVRGWVPRPLVALWGALVIGLGLGVPRVPVLIAHGLPGALPDWALLKLATHNNDPGPGAGWLHDELHRRLLAGELSRPGSAAAVEPLLRRFVELPPAWSTESPVPFRLAPDRPGAAVRVVLQPATLVEPAVPARPDPTLSHEEFWTDGLALAGLAPASSSGLPRVRFVGVLVPPDASTWGPHESVDATAKLGWLFGVGLRSLNIEARPDTGFDARLIRQLTSQRLGVELSHTAAKNRYPIFGYPVAEAWAIRVRVLRDGREMAYARYTGALTQSGLVPPGLPLLLRGSEEDLRALADLRADSGAELARWSVRVEPEPTGIVAIADRLLHAGPFHPALVPIEVFLGVASAAGSPAPSSTEPARP